MSKRGILQLSTPPPETQQCSNKRAKKTHARSAVAFFVISTGRPSAVPAMDARFAEQPTWIVGEGEADQYREAGAASVAEGGGLCESRNLALALALEQGKLCAQLSDDMRGLRLLPADQMSQDFNEQFKKHAASISIQDAARFIAEQMLADGSKLGGCYINANGGFAAQTSSQQPAHRKQLGDLVVIDPTCELLFDTGMTLKEDYDYTAQHLSRYGVVSRCNRIVPGGAAAHRTNPRGRR
jgi:hypothetical protein